MRIAYFVHQARLGSEMLVVRLLSALDRRRFEPLVVLATDGPLRARIEALGVPVHILPLSWWIPATHQSPEGFLGQLEGLGRRVDGVASLLEAEDVDLVHTHFIVTLEGALAAARLGLPHAWHSRGFFGDGFPPSWFDDTDYLLSVVDRLSDAILCASRGVERQMATVCRQARRAVIYDGLDLEGLDGRPAEAQAAFREEHRIADTARVVATAGGIQRRKGQLDLVEAARPLVETFPDLVFVLAGAASDTEYRARLVERIARHGLEPHFRLTGFVSAIRDVFATAEVFVHPSHSEGFGLGILEAMAMGLPVVATRSGGPEEIVEHGVTGMLVPVRDPRELGAALHGLLADPEGTRAMGRAAATRARTFTLDRTARETEAIYRELLAASPARQVIARSRSPLAAAVEAEILRRARLAGAS